MLSRYDPVLTFRYMTWQDADRMEQRHRWTCAWCRAGQQITSDGKRQKRPCPVGLTLFLNIRAPLPLK